MAVQRVEGLIVEKTGDDRLVYNDADNSAHVLNPMANRVFELCDGSRGAEQIAAELTEQGPEPVSLDVVWLALEELRDAGLVTVDGPLERHVNRRDLIIKFGVGAAAAAMLPVVEMIVAPDASTAVPQGDGDPVPSPVQVPTRKPTERPTNTPTNRPTQSPTHHHEEFWSRIFSRWHSWWEQRRSWWSQKFGR